jgi:hypothetical protein
MIVGDLIAIGDGRKVIGVGSAAADLSDIKEVRFMTKVANGRFKTSVPIARKNITSINRADYSAPQNKVITLGGVTEPLSFDIPTTGEGNITARNLSYNHTIATQRVNVSVEKLASETPEQYIDRVVAKLNASPGNNPDFFIAEKVVSGAYLGITITTANEHVDLDVTMDGIFEGASKRVTQNARVSLGKGADVVAMERDYNKNQGDGGYVELTELWYANPIEASAGVNYNIFTLAWEGVATRGTKTSQVANNTLALAVPTTESITPFGTLLALIFGNTYEPVGGFETATQTDNNPINQTQS